MGAANRTRHEGEELFDITTQGGRKFAPTKWTRGCEQKGIKRLTVDDDDSSVDTRIRDGPNPSNNTHRFPRAQPSYVRFSAFPTAHFHCIILRPREINKRRRKRNNIDNHTSSRQFTDGTLLPDDGQHFDRDTRTHDGHVFVVGNARIVFQLVATHVRPRRDTEVIAAVAATVVVAAMTAFVRPAVTVRVTTSTYMK